MKKANKKGSLDRFGTHRWLTDNVSEIVAGSGFAAAVLLFVLWDKSFPPDGRTRGDVRVSALAKATGASRRTVATALAFLEREGWIAAVADGPGGRKAYTVWHRRHGDSEQNETEQKETEKLLPTK